MVDCLPEVEHGRVLVTSRSKDAAQSLIGYHYDILNIEEMSCEDGKALFRTKCHHPQKEDELANLVMQLECVPLAITQAASFIQKWHPRMTISKYLEILNRTDSEIAEHLSKDIIDRRRDKDALNSVILTWKISFEHIQNKERSAADLLSFMKSGHT